MEWPPTAGDVVNVATPPASGDAPITEPPSLNVTVPVAPADGLTVAVNVTGCPNADGFRDEVNAVAVSTMPAATI
jgi:hypothetical protein